MKSFSTETVLKKSADFVLKEISKVLALKELLPHNRKLHKVRIRLKVVIEILKLMSRLDPATRLGKLQNHFRTIDKQIGKWHDNIILLNSLNDFTIQNAGKKNGHLKNLVGRIQYQQELQQQDIIGLINQQITPDHLKPIERLI